MQDTGKEVSGNCLIILKITEKCSILTLRYAGEHMIQSVVLGTDKMNN